MTIQNKLVQGKTEALIEHTSGILVINTPTNVS
jgi:hypothetical protein